MYELSKSSKEKLETCDKRLIFIVLSAIKISKIDFGVSCGHRSIEEQRKLFNEGKSRVDGVKAKGKHNFYPSKAVDLFAYVDGSISYEIADLSYIAGIIDAVANQLGYKVRWGGNWDGDGVIMRDQNFNDLPHFEIVD